MSNCALQIQIKSYNEDNQYKGKLFSIERDFIKDNPELLRDKIIKLVDEFLDFTVSGGDANV